MSGNQAKATEGDQKRCFVVMGFGVKSDYATGRKLDLDKSYRLMIKPVVEAKGLVCVRADEVRHSGSIDVLMYHELLTADVVIADLSTANPNALYELGIRHALRPHTTIVISENKLCYPFDLNHVLINSYTHLGEAIDYDEVVRFNKVLGDTLEAVLAAPKPDSPVYTYLNDLIPPSRREAVQAAVAEVERALSSEEHREDTAAGESAGNATGNATLSMLIEQGETAIKRSQFQHAKVFFSHALEVFKDSRGGPHLVEHKDPYLLQRLVLATYKAKEPDEISALREAMKLLVTHLNLLDSNDPETVGLGGAIEKRLFERGQGEDHLNSAIWFYGRGYYLRNDRYHGINLAYLLNVRTDTPLDEKQTEKIADLVVANRIRREVLKLCAHELQEIREGEQRRAANGSRDELQTSEDARQWEQKFWCLATMAEAYIGLGEYENYETTRAEALALKPAAWMMESFDGQVDRLRPLLVKHGHLLDPPWPGR